MANANPAENIARRNEFASQLYRLMVLLHSILCGLAHERREIYGEEGAPHMPVRKIEVQTKT